MNALPYLERVKIQCEILLPLYRRLREEIGHERAAELLRGAVREYGQAMGKAAASATKGSSLEKVIALLPGFSAGDALEIEPVAQDAKTLAVNVRRCEYARYFHELGEREFGAMVTCEVDHPLTEAIGPDLHLTRSDTLMRGATHCDFRWQMD